MADEKPQSPSFALYVLFSDGLQFSTRDIEAALIEDFPELDIQKNDALDFPQECDTDQMIPMAPIFFGADGADAGGVVNMIRLLGYGQWDPAQITGPQRYGALDIDLQDALRRNRSYLCISVSAKSDQLLDVFRAARLCSCLGAIFAELPICLAAYWETGDYFLSPEAIRRMARISIDNKWPVREWVGLSLSPGRKDGELVEWAQGLTRGLIQFTGYEFAVTPAPVPIVEAGQMLLGAMTTVLECGAIYNDGDTIGVEDKPDFKWRVRHVPPGVDGAVTKTLALIHPESKYDPGPSLGAPANRPPPPGLNNSKTYRKPIWQRLMGGGASR